MRRSSIFLVLLCLPLLGGCSASMQGWLASHGGVVQGRLQRRAQGVCLLLTRHTLHEPLRISVLNTPRAVAYSWPDGRIVVSAGLISSLKRSELAAVIAHEMGHLINDRRVHTRMALRGRKRGRNIEVAADATGCRVLSAAGFSRWDMVRMLDTVAMKIHNPAVRHAMLERAFVVCRRMRDLPDVRP